MKFSKFSIATVLLLFIFVGCSQNKLNENQNRQVYLNGKIYTANSKAPFSQAMVVENGKIIYVGDNENAKNFGGEVTDLYNQRVVPSFMDTHCHLLFYISLSSLDMEILDSELKVDELIDEVKKIANSPKHKNSPIFFAFGFGTDVQENNATAKLLDKAIPDKPAILVSESGHTAWFNTKALENANINEKTPDIAPGRCYFVRDKAGKPTGYIVEIDQVYWAIKKLGASTKEGIISAIDIGQNLYNKYGLTAVLDCGVFILDEEKSLEALRTLEDDDKLKVRFYTSITYTNKDMQPLDKLQERLKNAKKKYSSELVNPNTLKMFHDGTVETYSALMFEPFNPTSKGSGFSSLCNDELYEAAKVGNEENYNIHIHAIGDKAISQTLDLYKKLGKIKGTKTMAHVQIMPKDGIKRFIEQGDVFYQTTPVWLKAEEFDKYTLGKERYENQMPLGSIQRGGVPLTFGSDLPASGFDGMNPLLNIYYAVHRAKEGGNKMIPPKSEAITVTEAIDAYTINAAKQVGAEDKFGSLEVGKSADFVILSDDIISMPTENIKDVTVNDVYFRGKKIYHKL